MLGITVSQLKLSQSFFCHDTLYNLLSCILILVILSVTIVSDLCTDLLKTIFVVTHKGIHIYRVNVYFVYL